LAPAAQQPPAPPQHASLQWHGSYAAAAAGPARAATGPRPSTGGQASSAWTVSAASQGFAPSQASCDGGMGEELANKAAEVAVLRSRLQHFERENTRLAAEAAASKDSGTQSERARQQRAEVEQLQNELRYVRQDLANSEGERRRLQGGLKAAQELAEQEARKVQLAEQSASAASASLEAARLAQAPVPAAPQQVQPVSQPPPQPPQPARPTQPTQPHPAEHVPMAVDAGQWQQEALLRELAAWEAVSRTATDASPVASWFALRESIRQACLTGASASAGQAAAAVAERLRAASSGHHWDVVRGGARFVEVWAGFFPQSVQALAEGVPPPGAALFETLASALHAVVLDRDIPTARGEVESTTGNGTGERRRCCAQLLAALAEVAAKLQPPEMEALRAVLERPSLCALLAAEPSRDSLHLATLRLLQGLAESPALYALAHQAESEENPLLAVANLLIVPCVGGSPSEGQDSPQRQECRIAALELFVRCLATSPRLEVVLNLRAAPTVRGEPVDTVLQRVVLLCHHELLCLGLHGLEGGPWRDAELRACAGRRQCAVDRALVLMSSFVWHAAPWAPDTPAAECRRACAEACEAFGRTRPLLASIVDMIARRAQNSPAYVGFLSAASALRLLLSHADGEDSGCAPKARQAAGGVTPMVVDV